MLLAPDRQATPADGSAGLWASRSVDDGARAASEPVRTEAEEVMLATPVCTAAYTGAATKFKHVDMTLIRTTGHIDLLLLQFDISYFLSGFSQLLPVFAIWPSPFN
jgi:hypothetical protein